MFGEVRLGDKPFAAEVTPKGLLSRVDNKMSGKVRLGDKALTADLTGKRFMLTVSENVVL